jgi:translocator assembly and maintenance protein 41
MEASTKNLENALQAALLILPETFSEEELYMKIAGLSYMGTTTCNSFNTKIWL